jgi:hypothetical protein
MKFKRFSTYSLLLLITVLLGCGFPGDIDHKSDTEMIENFHKNRADFETLLGMIQEDERKIGKELFRIDNNWTAPKDLGKFGISKERVDKYREIFQQLDIQRGFYAYGEGKSCHFVSSAQGLGVSGSSKGYWWTEEPPGSLIEGDLDKYHRETEKPNDFVFRHIEGNWYLERDSS